MDQTDKWRLHQYQIETHTPWYWMENTPESKNKHIFRIVSRNVNSLCIDTSSQPNLREIFINSTMMQADALLFQETNTNFKKIEAQNILQHIMKFYHKNQTTSLSNSTVPAKITTGYQEELSPLSLVDEQEQK